jgi:hypothetical protein
MWPHSFLNTAHGYLLTVKMLKTEKFWYKKSRLTGKSWKYFQNAAR